jgi:5-(carboxyamino)imidazole ribonucleotide synthase
VTTIAPGATIGILGGGQLGRMLALAAGALGYRTHVFCPEHESPAFQVSTRHTVAAYDNEDALARFASAVSVVTFEFENVPAPTAEFLAKRSTIRPSARALSIAQDRLDEKNFVRSVGGNTVPYAAVSSGADCAAALAAVGLPGILKTRRLGYDGKGQRTIASAGDIELAWIDLGAGDCIYEGLARFTMEISVVLARGADGAIVTYDVPRNVHEGGILRSSTVPAGAAGTTVATALDQAHRVAAALDYVGVLAVEMFVLADGSVVVNEIAPRVHNSGHWTIDACVTSQFEQHIRAVCGLPLGSVERHSDAEMRNLIGDEIDRWPEHACDPAAKLHLYGKTEVRPGRKMGHVTLVRPRAAR